MEKVKEKEVNALLDCAATVLALVAPFRRGDRGAGMGEGFRESVLAGFDELERTGLERQIGTPVLREARYALASLVDEAVLSSSWGGRTAWMSNPLQLEMFGDHLAGERFFEKLSFLRQGGEANVELLELYYVCLQLGFEGVYKLRGLEQLTALQVDLRSQIDDYRGVTDPRLSPHAAPREGFVTRVRREIPSWVIGVATVAVIFFTYLGYALAVERAMKASVAGIEGAREALLRQGAAGEGGAR